MTFIKFFDQHDKVVKQLAIPPRAHVLAAGPANGGKFIQKTRLGQRTAYGVVKAGRSQEPSATQFMSSRPIPLRRRLRHDCYTFPIARATSLRC